MGPRQSCYRPCLGFGVKGLEAELIEKQMDMGGKMEAWVLWGFYGVRKNLNAITTI